MKNMEKLPRPTEKEFEIKKQLEEKGFTDEYIDFMNSYDWSAEVFCENEKYGLKSCLNKTLIPPLFDDFKLLSGHDVPEGTKVVTMLNGKWGIVKADGKGEWMIQPDYDDIGYPNTLTYVRIGNKFGVLNTVSNQLVIPVELDEIIQHSGFMFMNGIGIFNRNNKYGVINQFGELSDAIFDDIDFDGTGLVEVVFNGERGYVDSNGLFTTEEDNAYFMEIDF